MKMIENAVVSAHTLSSAIWLSKASASCWVNFASSVSSLCKITANSVVFTIILLNNGNSNTKTKGMLQKGEGEGGEGGGEEEGEGEEAKRETLLVFMSLFRNTLRVQV